MKCASLIFAFLAAASACLPTVSDAEDLQCPPEVDSDMSPSSEWMTEYYGHLNQVVLFSTYNLKDIKSIVSCYRAVGVKSLKTQKRCRLIEGSGKVDNWGQSKDNEMHSCMLPKLTFQKTNDKDCIIVCE
jgi:hypothetical protein